MTFLLCVFFIYLRNLTFSFFVVVLEVGEVDWSALKVKPIKCDRAVLFKVGITPGILLTRSRVG